MAFPSSSNVELGPVNHKDTESLGKTVGLGSSTDGVMEVGPDAAACSRSPARWQHQAKRKLVSFEAERTCQTLYFAIICPLHTSKCKQHQGHLVTAHAYAEARQPSRLLDMN